jgi:anti-sigma regulatory factor (Ser/Thr protein kinase)
MKIERIDNVVYVRGHLVVQNYRFVLKHLYDAIENCGYEDVILDFSECEYATPASMLPVIAIVLEYQNQRVDFDLKLPKDRELKKLFGIRRWSNLIDPEKYKYREVVSEKSIPVRRYLNADDQFETVSEVMKVFAKSIENATSESLAAIEWILNEITDNVLNHAQSDVGGIVEAKYYPDYNSVEMVVADAGLGIPRTLNPSLKDNVALEHAVSEGVTRDSKTNQGNGLFGSMEVARVTGGLMEVHSYRGSLKLRQNGSLQSRLDNVPYQGTMVWLRITCDAPEVLARALKFRGKTHIPAFEVRDKFREGDSDRVTVRIADEVSSTGSRESGKAFRSLLEKMLTEGDIPERIVIDFEGKKVISSSFADEVFGMLCSKYGINQFYSVFRIVNTNELIDGLIERAIAQRLLLG